MKTYLTLKLFAVFLIYASHLQGQNTIEKLKYDAYIQRDYIKWQKAVKYIEQNTDLSKTENLQELIHCYYGLTSTLIGKKMHNDAANAIKKGETLIETLLKKEPNNALGLSYKGVFIGYEIALNRMKAFKLGKSGINYINKAVQSASNNPQILFDKGNSLYYPPKFFGGSKKEALKYYQKAINILEKQNKTQSNWIYLQLLVVEGHCYELLEEDNLAEKSYLKILKLAPDFQTVKNDLYPKLKNRMNGISKEKPKEIDYSLDNKK